MVNNDWRISGLASGMDTESMVKKLMDAQRVPLQKMKQQKQSMEWKRDLYRELNTSMMDLRTEVFNMKLQGTFTKSKVSSSNEAVASATATSAPSGVYSLKVNDLASGAFLTSQASMGIVNSDTDPVNTTGVDKTITIGGEKGTATITISGTDTIGTIVNNINAQKNATGVQVSYDKNLGRLFFSSTTMGANAKVEIGGTDAAWAQSTFQLGSLTDTGTNADFIYNGMSFTNYNSNEVSINGMNISLKAPQSAGDSPITFTVSNDVDGLVDSVKKFVDKYNEIITKINNELSEKVYRDFKPLTDEQKEDMSDDQIEKWEERAKSGLVRNDMVLSKTVSQLRLDLTDSVVGLGNEMNSLFDLGIETGSYDKKGQLIIKDEKKLREALTTSPEKVMDLFTKTHDTDRNQRGLAQRMYDTLNSAMDDITGLAGSPYSFSGKDDSSMGKQLADIDKRIGRFEDKLVDIESRYWRQFTAMEKAIQRSNAQSGWLSQQLGGGA